MRIIFLCSVVAFGERGRSGFLLWALDMNTHTKIVSCAHSRKAQDIYNSDARATIFESPGRPTNKNVVCYKHRVLS